MFLNYKNLISIGDFYDAYHKLRLIGLRSILSRLSFTEKGRIKNAWRHIETPPTNWWAIPQILQRRNFLITGDKDVEFPDYIYNKYLKGKSNLRAVSPGCGTGTLELKFAKFNCFRLIEAFDISKNRISKAIQEANNLNINNVKFFVDDVYNFDFGVSNYDMILFYGCLHHFKNIDYLLARIRQSLTLDGILVVYEYVGPNRFQWTDTQLQTVNKLLKQIPPVYRKRWNSDSIKKRQYRPGILRMILSDPSEAVESENILPLLQKYFNALEIKKIGGNILQLVLKEIAHHFLSENEKTSEILKYLFNEEDKFLKENQSDFIFGVFQ